MMLGAFNLQSIDFCLIVCWRCISEPVSRRPKSNCIHQLYSNCFIPIAVFAMKVNISRSLHWPFHWPSVENCYSNQIENQFQEISIISIHLSVLRMNRLKRAKFYEKWFAWIDLKLAFKIDVRRWGCNWNCPKMRWLNSHFYSLIWWFIIEFIWHQTFVQCDSSGFCWLNGNNELAKNPNSQGNFEPMTFNRWEIPNDSVNKKQTKQTKQNTKILRIQFELKPRMLWINHMVVETFQEKNGEYCSMNREIDVK